MSRSKSHWREPPASDQFAEPESAGGYEYGSPGIQAQPSSYLDNERNPKSKMTRKGSESTKSRRSSTADAEFEEDDEWNGGSDEDSTKKSKKRGDSNDKLIKRRDQNRVSQRAFRQRKERHTKELEAKVEELENLLETASHENSIVNSQMGRMEEELCYYRRLLFTGTRQNRLPLTPSSYDASQPASYTSSGQNFGVSRYSTTALQSGDFGIVPQVPITTPYMASYHSELAANYGTAIPSPQYTENNNSSFGSHRYTPPSVDSCSSRNQTPARSCSPPTESPAHSPIITSPIPHHPNASTVRANVDGAFWDLDISSFNVNDEAFPAATTGQDVPGYLRYSTGWTG